jgi:hypothetical protein
MKLKQIGFNQYKYDFRKKVSLNLFRGRDVWFFESPELKILDYVAVEDAPTKSDVHLEFAKVLHSMVEEYRNTDDFSLSDESYEKKFRLITYIKNF